MCNVNNKFALKQGGWNTVDPDTALKDHTMREIARPNNDTLYIGCMPDLRKDPVILEMPAFDSARVVKIDGSRFRAIAERIRNEEMAKATESEFKEKNLLGMFQPKGRIDLDVLLFQSVLGPIGQPADEAVYPAITTTDNEPMNATHDYVIRMEKDELPPAKAFWSLTLYDKDGFFIPNDRKKYSVGENAGMKLNEESGIEIRIAAEKPEGVPDENWLPIMRKDEEIGVVLRVYGPDLEKMKTWEAPKAEPVSGEVRRAEAGRKRMAA